MVEFLKLFTQQFERKFDASNEFIHCVWNLFYVVMDKAGYGLEDTEKKKLEEGVKETLSFIGKEAKE